MKRLVYASIGLLLAQSATLAAEPSTVSIEADDGFALVATQWPGESDAGAALLLHQCNTSRVMYESLGAALSEHGLFVLSLDARGYGDSATDAISVASIRTTATSREDYFEQVNPILAHWPGDMDAALAYLQQHSGAAMGDIVLVGASCGGSQAVSLVDRNDPFAGIVLFSVGLDAEREAILTSHSELSVLLVGSESDGADREAGVGNVFPRLFAASENERTTLHLYKGDRHGYPLFEHEPALLPLMSAWVVDRVEE